MNKQNIRNKIKMLRNSYSNDELKKKSLNITNAFYKTYSFKHFLIILPHR